MDVSTLFGSCDQDEFQAHEKDPRLLSKVWQVNSDKNIVLWKTSLLLM